MDCAGGRAKYHSAVHVSRSIVQFAEIFGEVGTYISTPDSAAASITGSIDLRATVAADYSPSSSAILISKDDGGADDSYLFWIESDSKLYFRYSPDGTAKRTATSSVTISQADFTKVHFRATYNSSTGKVNFYTSTIDLDTWTALGAEQSITAGSIFDGAEAVTIGLQSGGTASLGLIGKVYRAQIYNGINGTLAVDYNANDYDTGLTQTSSETSEVWTYNGNASVFSPYSRWVTLDGTGDYVSTPDSAAASVTM